jgi:SAM-dependent methyltransferase
VTDSPGFVRPDPAAGQRGDAAYADHWSKSHETVTDPLGYRADYIDVLVLDALLPEGYRLLDIGCGTAGYHRLLTRHGHVHGIDFMPEMIEQAERFKRDFDIQNAQYTCATFEDFEDSSGYDAIRMPGVYGWYRSWHGQQIILEKLRNLLSPGGIAQVSYVAPVSIIHWTKTLLCPSRTVVIPESRFLSMVARAGLVPIISMIKGDSTHVFLRVPM